MIEIMYAGREVDHIGFVSSLERQLLVELVLYPLITVFRRDDDELEDNVDVNFADVVHD